MDIIKASGEREKFAKNKFCDSLKKTGAPDDVVKNVCDVVLGEVKDNKTTTSEIFNIALHHLLKSNIKAAARYNIRNGIRALGPAGFLFEQYLEVLLKEMGYTTERNKIMKGKCVSHEVDILAKKNNKHFIVEAKYHNNHGIKTHIDVVMYAHARFKDIEYYRVNNNDTNAEHIMWLITNTKFTSKAHKYAKCSGIKLTGWCCKGKNNLEEIIEKYLLYPVTILPSVDANSIEKFAKHDIMLVRDLALYSKDDLIRRFDINKNIAPNIIKEAFALIYGDNK